MSESVKKEDYKYLDNLVQCECDNWHHYKYTAMDGDGNNACPECQVEFQSELIKGLKGLVKRIADPELSSEDTINQIKIEYSKIIGVDIDDLDELNYFDDVEL